MYMLALRIISHHIAGSWVRLCLYCMIKYDMLFKFIIKFFNKLYYLLVILLKYYFIVICSDYLSNSIESVYKSLFCIFMCGLIISFSGIPAFFSFSSYCIQFSVDCECNWWYVFAYRVILVGEFFLFWIFKLGNCGAWILYV